VHGADVNKPNNRQETPLHFAARSGNLETVQLLVSLKGDLTFPGAYHPEKQLMFFFYIYYVNDILCISWQVILFREPRNPNRSCAARGAARPAAFVSLLSLFPLLSSLMFFGFAVVVLMLYYHLVLIIFLL